MINHCNRRITLLSDTDMFFYTPAPWRGRGYTVLPLSVSPSVLPSVQDIFRCIFLSNYWWQKSDIWSQVSYRYTILWVAFLDTSDSYLLFADLVGFYAHWTYVHIFRHIFLSNYWWQKSDIWSQASYRYPISWEAFLDPSDSYFLFADERGYHKWALADSSSCLLWSIYLLSLVYWVIVCNTLNTEDILLSCVYWVIVCNTLNTEDIWLSLVYWVIVCNTLNTEDIWLSLVYWVIVCNTLNTEDILKISTEQKICHLDEWYVYHSHLSWYVSDCTVSVSLRWVICLSQSFVMVCLWLYCNSITKMSDMSITVICHGMSLTVLYQYH
jgi:hypothetical protein